MMSQALTVTEVHTVVVRATNRLFVANTGEGGKTWIGCKRRIKRPIAALRTNRLRQIRHPLVDVDGLVFVQSEHVGVFRLNNRVLVQSPAIADVELLGHWVAVIGIDQAANTTRCERSRRWQNRGKWADTVLPLAKSLASTRNRVRRTREAQHGLKDCWVSHLFHEQRNVLEDIAEIQTEAAANNVPAGTGQVIRKADARADVFIIVGCYLPDVGIRNWAIECDKFLIRAALANVRTADHVKVLVPSDPEIERKFAGNLPVILKVQSQLFGSHDESGVAVGDGHGRHETRSRKALGIRRGVAEDVAGIFCEVNFQR